MNFVKVYETLEEAVRNDFGVEPIWDETFQRRFYLWDDMFSWDENNRPHPCFSVKETASTFFARSSWWLRWKYRETDNGFVLNGVPLVPKRTESGSRYYTLADIERIGHAMAACGDIGGEKLAQIMTILLVQAALYGVFDPKKKSRS